MSIINLLKYPYLSVGRLFRDEKSPMNATWVVFVSLPIGGEVISRLVLVFQEYDIYILYPYLSVGRLFRDSPVLLIPNLVTFVSLPIGGEVISRL